jgi:acyl-CoA synthetase (NDP forming)
MFAPRSVALVGVPGDPGKAMFRPLRYLSERGFSGGVYPVNPRYSELAGIRCYADLADVPKPVDLVLSFVSATRTIAVVTAAADAGAAAVVVFASGFSETGPAGAELQHELTAVAAKRGIRVLGPNCQGLIYAPANLFATFTGAVDRDLPEPSGIAYVGQSGAVGGSILDLAAELGIGLTAWVSTGNQADVDLVGVASALLADEKVQVIMLYVEGIGSGAHFTDLCREARRRGVRIALLKTGRSASGQRAAASHTGSMLGDSAAFSLVCQEEGALLVEDVDELLTVAVAATGPPAGPRVAIVTTSGGAGALAADHCDMAGLSVPELSARTRGRLAPLVPSFGAVANPVDVTAEILSPHAREESLGTVCRILAEDEIDVILVVLTMVTGDAAAALARDLVRTRADLAVPLFVIWMAGDDLTHEGRRLLRGGGIPVFPTVSSVVRALGRLAEPVRTHRPVAQRRGGEGDLAEFVRRVAAGESGDNLLDRLGIGHPASAMASCAGEALAIAGELAGPFALKIHAPSLLHKSDVGGVALGVGATEVVSAFEDLMNRGRQLGLSDLRGVLIQEMLPQGVELLLALTSGGDGFPPVLTVGLGGVTAEIFHDLASATAPVDAADAEAMLRRLNGWPLLEGFRGSPQADVPAAVRTIAAFSSLAAAAADHPMEIEINPLIVAAGRGGAKAADVLVTFSES